MRRKFSAFVALVACLIPLTAGALGLGQLKVNSALSQPLNAQIELLSASESELAGMTVRLAPADAFARVGLDRPFYLSQLKFDVVPGPAGLASIRVSSEASISEPFISFLVEVVWSRGRLLREYTILLDPPTTDGKGAPSVEAATAQSAAQPAAVSDSVPAPAPRTATTAPRTTFSAPMQPSAGSYGPVKRGDTLWKIANGLRPDDGVSVEQMMIALLQNNSQAFYDNNINRLKAGYVLRVPSRDEITSLSQSDALAEVRSQYAAYNLYRQQRAGTSSAPQVAGGVSGGGETSAPQEPRLKLVSPSDDKAGEQPSSGAGGGEAVSEERLLAQEASEAQRLENQELQSRVGDMEDKVVELERQIELKNEELAMLQSRLSEEGSGTEAAEPAEQPAVTEASEAASETAEQMGEKATDEAMASDAAQPAEGETATEGEATGDEVSSEQAASDAAAEQQAAAEKAAAEAAVADAAAKAEAAAKAAQMEAEQHEDAQPGLMGWVMENLMLVGGGAIALLVLIMVALKRRGGGDDEEEGSLVEQADAAASADADSSPSLMDTIVSEGLEQTLPEGGAGEEGPNYLAEADVYIAYGNNAEAEKMMREAVAAEPNRSDYRLKLLEILHSSNAAEAFDTEAEALHPMIDSDASPVWTKVASMGRDLNPENELYTAGEEDSMLADADLDMDLGDEGEELQGLGGGEESLDEPPLDLDFELPAGEELEALGDLDGDAGGDLDFSLDLDAEGEAEVESEAEAAGDLDFDLDLDATVASDEAPLEADESMDFDLGGLGADAAADEVVADAPSVELDLSELEGEDEVGDLDLEAGLDFDFSVEEEGQDGAETLEGLSDEIADVDSDDLDLQLSTVKGEATDDGEGNINIEWDFTAAGEDPAALAEDDEPSIEFDLGAMGDEVAADEEADPDASINATLDVDRDELLAGELDDLSDISEVTPDPGSMADTKLDLAKAYIDMGDEDGARSILEEVLSEGDDGQQAKAHELLEQLPK